MRMLQIVLIGVGLAMTGAAGPAMAGDRGGVHPPRPAVQQDGMRRWGPRYQGRWYAGWRAPGGWSAYHRPVRGFILPRYWVSPSYYIANYPAYSLPAPAPGYGWSRYYDDAVMTDRHGRVYDYRSDIEWDRYEGGYGDYAENRRDTGVGGAAIGAVVGGVAGNRIAGRGNRTEGTLIGAGVGAVAGMAIDKAEDDRRRSAPPSRPGARYDDGYDYGYADDAVTSSNEYEGRWTGTWTTDDGRTVSGTYDGRFEGDVRGAGVDYPPPPYDGGAHWGGAPIAGGGYVSGGYYYPAPVVTTVTVQPAVTTTTTTTYVTETVAPRKTVRRTRRACRCK